MQVNSENELIKMQSTLMIIAREVKRICEKNDIKYSMMGGTLLGAVRHGGFIPWDDDIDFMMTRSYFEKFIKCCERDLGCEFELLSWHTNQNYGNGHIKILLKGTLAKESEYAKYPQCFFVDIFPMDRVSDCLVVRNVQCLICRIILRILQIQGGMEFKSLRNIKKILYSLFYTVSKCVSHDFLVKLCEKIMTRYSGKENNCYFCDIVGAYPMKKETVDSEILKSYISLKFDNEYFMAVKEYDKLLQQYYGDYMILPPVEKRVNHSFLEIDFGIF